MHIRLVVVGPARHYQHPAVSGGGFKKTAAPVKGVKHLESLLLLATQAPIPRHVNVSHIVET